MIQVNQLGPHIEYFMWGYQSHFRFSLQSAAKRLFDSIGITEEPEAFLIGIKIEERPERHPVCIEPEDCFWLLPATLDGVLDEVKERSLQNPASHLYISDARSQQLHVEGIKKQALLDAIRDRIDANPARPSQLEFHFSPFVEIDGFLVTAVIGLPISARSLCPQLQTDSYQIHELSSFPIPTSIIHAAIGQLLSEATEALSRKDKANFFLGQSVDHMLRNAANQMIIGIVLRCDLYHNTFGAEQNCFDNICRIAAASYEGAKAYGRLAIARQEHPQLLKIIEFDGAVAFNETRRMRKLLELTRAGECRLHTNSNNVWGLVEIQNSPADSIAEDLFEVRITGQHCWECAYSNHVLFRVENRIPKLPGEEVDSDAVRSDMVRLFPDLATELIERYIALIKSCATQEHGALLIISPEAEQESKRLALESTAIRPVPVDAQLMYSLASIDGAVLLDLEGNCHAIGVILDGIACESGNPARGARYNSAIRYVETRKTQANVQCVAFIVSEDGGVDRIPRLRPTISREKIDEAIRCLQDAVAEKTVSRKTRQCINWLEEHRFYLHEGDCDLLNALVPVADEILHQKSGSSIQIMRTKFTVHPRFDPSFFYS